MQEREILSSPMPSPACLPDFFPQQVYLAASPCLLLPNSSCAYLMPWQDH